MKVLEIPWVVPPPSNSHHQDYEPFLVGDPNQNLHLPQASWEGGQPKRYPTSFVKSLKRITSICFWFLWNESPFQLENGCQKGTQPPSFHNGKWYRVSKMHAKKTRNLAKSGDIMSSRQWSNGGIMIWQTTTSRVPGWNQIIFFNFISGKCSGWFKTNPSKKICSSNWIISPGREWKKKPLKPPSRISLYELWSLEELDYHHLSSKGWDANGVTYYLWLINDWHIKNIADGVQHTSTCYLHDLSTWCNILIHISSLSYFNKPCNSFWSGGSTIPSISSLFRGWEGKLDFVLLQVSNLLDNLLATPEPRKKPGLTFHEILVV